MSMGTRRIIRLLISFGLAVGAMFCLATRLNGQDWAGELGNTTQPAHQVQGTPKAQPT